MALEAVKQTDGYRLDKNHTFSVNLLSDFDRYEILIFKKKLTKDLFFRLTQVPPEPSDIV